jgi:hypothetical protein
VALIQRGNNFSLPFAERARLKGVVVCQSRYSFQQIPPGLRG